MIVAAQDQLKIVVPDPGSVLEDSPQKLDRGPLNNRPFVKDRVENHRKLMHGHEEDLSHKCGKCGVTFRRLAALRAHMSSHLSGMEKKVLRNHGVPGEKFNSKILEIYKKKPHKQTPKAVPKAQCNICKRLLLNKFVLKNHIKNVHIDDGPHICNICQKESPSNHALKEHKRNMHESVRKYKCSFCKKAFKKQLLLKEHMAVHLRVPLYKCQFCEKTFNSNTYRCSHRKWKHPEEYQKWREAKFGK